MLELKNQLEGMLRLQREIYGGQMGRGHEFQVNTTEEEASALADGCHELKQLFREPSPGVPPFGQADALGAPRRFISSLVPMIPPPSPEILLAIASPKKMVHPDISTAPAPACWSKIRPCKNAEQEIWKLERILAATILDALKQAAIEEGQWDEKRELESDASDEQLNHFQDLPGVELGTRTGRATRSRAGSALAGVLALFVPISRALSKYGLEKLFARTIHGLQAKGLSREEVVQKIEAYPISREL